MTLGLIIAQLNDIQKASSFANLLNITLAILGGLWFPVYTFPDWLQSISKHMPTYNLKLLAIDLAQNKGVNIEAFGYLVVYCIIFVSIALFMNKKGDVH